MAEMMDEPPQKKIKLSKGILDMKFMKKTKERVQEEEERAAGEAFFRANRRDDPEPNYIIVESYSQVLDLVPGRVSFHGMNPEIEAIMAEEQKAKEEKAKLQQKLKHKRQDLDITDEDFAERYNALISNPGKRYKTRSLISNVGKKPIQDKFHYYKS